MQATARHLIDGPVDFSPNTEIHFGVQSAANRIIQTYSVISVLFADIVPMSLQSG